MFEFIIGLIVGVLLAIGTAIFFPGAWSKLLKETREEVKR